MALNRRTAPNQALGLQNALQNLAPQPIVAQRAPGTSDIAQVGSLWVDVPSDAWYVLTSVVAGSANWEGQSGGTGTFTNISASS